MTPQHQVHVTVWPEDSSLTQGEGEKTVVSPFLMLLEHFFPCQRVKDIAKTTNRADLSDMQSKLNVRMTRTVSL